MTTLSLRECLVDSQVKGSSHSSRTSSGQNISQTTHNCFVYRIVFTPELGEFFMHSIGWHWRFAWYFKEGGIFGDDLYKYCIIR